MKYNMKNIDIDLFENDDELVFEETTEEFERVVEDYLKLNYKIDLYYENNEEDNYWVASCPELNGCKSHGGTEIEALDNLKSAKRNWFYSMLESDVAIPLPGEDSVYKDFSGKLLLRMPKELHFNVNLAAKKENISINQKLVNIIHVAIVESKHQSELSIVNKKINDMDEKVTLLFNLFNERKLEQRFHFKEKTSSDSNKFSKLLEKPGSTGTKKAKVNIIADYNQYLNLH